MELRAEETEKGFSPGEKSAEQFREGFEEAFFKSELSTVLLTLMGVKPATDVEAFFNSEEQYRKCIEFLNSTGLNCFIEEELEETMAENFVDAFGEAETEEIREMLDKTELKARLFVTPESYEREFFRPMLEKNYSAKHHRRYGEFLKFHRENIEAFVYNQLGFFQKVFYRLKRSKPPAAISQLEALEKYGEDLSMCEKKAFTTFSFQKLADSKQVFREVLEEVRERKKTVDESGLEFEFFFEQLGDGRVEERFD